MFLFQLQNYIHKYTYTYTYHWIMNAEVSASSVLVQCGFSQPVAPLWRSEVQVALIQPEVHLYCWILNQFNAVQCSSMRLISMLLQQRPCVAEPAFNRCLPVSSCQFSSSEDILPASIFFPTSSCAVSHDYKDYNKNGLR